MKKKEAVKKLKWVKPTVKIEELTMKSLLGENGWMESMRSDNRRLISFVS